MPAPFEVLRDLLNRVIAAAQPAAFLAPFWPPRPQGRIIVTGCGKAAASMARAAEDHYGDDLEGVVVTRYGYGAKSRAIQIMEAAHPVPDDNSLAAADKIMAAVARAGRDDLVLCLISGGGSSLMCKPAPGLSLADKQALNRELLRCGASIAEMNTVRKHLSQVKGGRLAVLNPNARMHALILSDVPGDDLSAIASGPTVPDATRIEEALSIVETYALDLPPVVLAALRDPANETPKPGDDGFARVRNTLAMTPHLALLAAVRRARELGYDVVYLGDSLEGDANKLGAHHARLARELAEAKNRICIISGGEASVAVMGEGRGGRNSQYLLSLGLGLGGCAGVFALAADTDGIDGTEDNAGSILGPDFLDRARRANIDPAERLARNDAYSVFAATNGLVVTGPTLTNVNDFRAILIDKDG